MGALVTGVCDAGLAATSYNKRGDNARPPGYKDSKVHQRSSKVLIGCPGAVFADFVFAGSLRGDLTVLAVYSILQSTPFVNNRAHRRA